MRPIHQDYCEKFDHATQELSVLITGVCPTPIPHPFLNPSPPTGSPHLKRKFAAMAAVAPADDTDDTAEEDPYGFDPTPGPVGSGCGLCAAAPE